MKTLAYNKRAVFDYEIFDTMEAGLSLLGTEVKSVRTGNISLRGAFITLHNDEAFLTNATIPPWQVKNTPPDYDPTRPRKLLLKRSELHELAGARTTRGLTVIPLRVYNRRGRLKLQIGLARGKRKFEKREAKREHDIHRDVERVLRGKE